MDGAQESAFLCSSRWCRCYWDMNHTYSHWSKGPQKFDSLQYQKITEARSLSGVLFAPSMIEGQTKMEDHDYKIFIQFSSVAQSCPTLCDPMNCSTPGLPVHHHLPNFTQLTSIQLVMPSSLGSSSFSILSFCLFICSRGSQGKNTEVVCHSLLQWTTFCQTSPPWPARLGLPHGHGLVSLS